MVKTKRIPVVRNRVVVGKSRVRSKLVAFTAVISVLALTLFYIWLKFEINLLLGEIQRLEQKNKQILDHNGELRAEIIRLEDFSRIHRIAEEQLGLVFIPDEDIIEITK